MAVLYFINGLSDQQLERLDDAGIEYSTQKLSRSPAVPLSRWQRWGLASVPQHEEISGILVDDAQYRELLAVLGATEEATEPMAAPNTLCPKLKFDQIPKPVVAIYSWREELDPSRFVDIVRRVLLPHIDTDIVLHLGESAQGQAPVDDGLFHIYLFASPLFCQPSQVTCSTLWGINLDQRSKFLAAARQGTLILDDELNEIGELLDPFNAYLYFEVLRLGWEQELLVFERFCEELHVLRNLSETERAAHVEAIKQGEEATRRTVYIEHCAARVEAAIAGAEQRVKDADAELVKIQAQYLAAMNRVENEQRLLASLKSDSVARNAEIAREFEQFQNDPKILRVVPFSNGVRVFTRLLYCYCSNSKKVRKIGEMRIDILLTAREATNPIRIFNMTQIRAGRATDHPHPHVNSDGTLCHGNSAATFIQLVRARELYATASYAIQFVESTSASVYHNFSSWPLVAESELPKLRALGLLPTGA